VRFISSDQQHVIQYCIRYETVIKRWPVIITGVIDQVHNACHVYSLQSQQPDPDKDLDARVAEGKGIIEQISKLKYQMARDHPLESVLLLILLNLYGIRQRFTDPFQRMVNRMLRHTTLNWCVWLRAGGTPGLLRHGYLQSKS
jgi:Damage-control phosphatase ARMT1-like domain